MSPPFDDGALTHPRGSLSSPLHVSEVAMLLPHMLSQLILTRVASADAFDTSGNLAEVQWTTDAVDTGLATGAILVTNEGREAVELGACEWALSGRSCKIWCRDDRYDSAQGACLLLQEALNWESLEVTSGIIKSDTRYAHRRYNLVPICGKLS